jgi:hypothetical protein
MRQPRAAWLFSSLIEVIAVDFLDAVRVLLGDADAVLDH